MSTVPYDPNYKYPETSTYVILQSPTPGDLATLVDIHVHNGWQPLGSPFIIPAPPEPDPKDPTSNFGYHICQAITRLPTPQWHSTGEPVDEMTTPDQPGSMWDNYGPARNDPSITWQPDDSDKWKDQDSWGKT